MDRLTDDEGRILELVGREPQRRERDLVGDALHLDTMVSLVRERLATATLERTFVPGETNKRCYTYDLDCP
jgi:hypothetical protein